MTSISLYLPGIEEPFLFENPGLETVSNFKADPDFIELVCELKLQNFVLQSNSRSLLNSKPLDSLEVDADGTIHIQLVTAKMPITQSNQESRSATDGFSGLDQEANVPNDRPANEDLPPAYEEGLLLVYTLNGQEFETYINSETTLESFTKSEDFLRNLDPEQSPEDIIWKCIGNPLQGTAILSQLQVEDLGHLQIDGVDIYSAEYLMKEVTTFGLHLAKGTLSSVARALTGFMSAPSSSPKLKVYYTVMDKEELIEVDLITTLEQFLDTLSNKFERKYLWTCRGVKLHLGSSLDKYSIGNTVYIQGHDGNMKTTVMKGYRKFKGRVHEFQVTIIGQMQEGHAVRGFGSDRYGQYYVTGFATDEIVLKFLYNSRSVSYIGTFTAGNKSFEGTWKLSKIRKGTFTLLGSELDS